MSLFGNRARRRGRRAGGRVAGFQTTVRSGSDIGLGGRGSPSSVRFNQQRRFNRRAQDNIMPRAARRPRTFFRPR